MTTQRNAKGGERSEHTPTPGCKVVEWENINLFDKTKTKGYHIVFPDGKKCLVNNKELCLLIVRAVNSHEALLEAAKDALCELDPDCNFDGSNYKGEPSDKGDSRVQTILALYKVIEQAKGGK